MFENVPTGIEVRRRVGAFALLAGALWAIDGGVGVGLAVLVGVVWTKVQTPYVVAAGQLSYAVLSAETGVLGVLGVVSFSLLFVPGFLRQWRMKTASIATAVLVAATAGFAGSLLFDSIALAAFVSCIGFGVAAYSVHRYELVRFGLVEPDA